MPTERQYTKKKNTEKDEDNASEQETRRHPDKHIDIDN